MALYVFVVVFVLIFLGMTAETRPARRRRAINAMDWRHDPDSEDDFEEGRR